MVWSWVSKEYVFNQSVVLSYQMSGVMNVVEIVKGELERVNRGKPIKVYYQSNRGDKSRKNVGGELVNINWIEEDNVELWFYNQDDERKYCTVIGDTLDESVVKSQKTTTATTVGNAVRVLVPDDMMTVDELGQEHVFEKRNGEYSTVVAAAKIKYNESVLPYVTNGE